VSHRLRCDGRTEGAQIRHSRNPLAGIQRENRRTQESGLNQLTGDDAEWVRRAFAEMDGEGGRTPNAQTSRPLYNTRSLHLQEVFDADHNHVPLHMELLRCFSVSMSLPFSRELSLLSGC
jgi:hypothetical protein